MGELLADHTTLRLGGPADRFLTHTHPADWPGHAQDVRRHGLTPYVLGGGSNTLADDTGHPGPVIRMATCGIAVYPLEDGLVEVVAQAGEPLGSFVAFTAAEGLSGIEYLGGIPGTVGAAFVQNSGAYGQEIADTVTRLTAYDWHLGQTTILRPADCRFGYRTSIFKRQPGRWTILEIALRLARSRHAAPVTYRHLAAALSVTIGAPAHRSPTRPRASSTTVGTAVCRCPGTARMPAKQAPSSSTRPSPLPRRRQYGAAGGPVHRDQSGHLRASAEWLVEQAGYHPGAQVAPGIFSSERRALTLAARDGATAASFTTALQRLAAQVLATTGIQLTPEPVRPHHAPDSGQVAPPPATKFPV